MSRMIEFKFVMVRIKVYDIFSYEGEERRDIFSYRWEHKAYKSKEVFIRVIQQYKQLGKLNKT
jgi:hypothetical protein